MKNLIILAIILAGLRGTGAVAQTSIDIFEKHREQLTKHYKEVPAMTLHLQMSQQVAVAGDSISVAAWYKRANGETVEGDHIVQLDLVNGLGKVVQQLKFKVRNGVGETNFVVDPDLAPGYYQVVAYTTWMRNFGDQFFFKSFLAVIEGNGLELTRTSSPVAQIFPEGGVLIAGVWNKALVKAKPNTSFAIVDESGQMIKQLATSGAGYAVLHFKPLPAKTYRIRSTSTPEVTQPVQIDRSGVALEWVDSRQEFVFRGGEQAEAVCAFLVQADRVVANKVLKLDPFDSVSWKIPEFPTASNLHLLVTNSQGVIVGYRPFLYKNQPPRPVTLSTPGKVQQRQMVRGSFSLPQSARANEPAWVAINVFDKKLQLKPAAEQPVDNDLMIGSANSAYLGKTLDALPRAKFPYRGLPVISGLISAKLDGRPCPDSTVVIGFLQNNLVSYEAITSEGRFNMPLLYDLFGRDEVFLTFQTRDKILDSDYELKVISDSVNHADRFGSLVSKEPHPYSAYATVRNLASKSYFFFSQDETLSKTIRPNERFEEEFQGADYSVDVQKYVVFPTMVDLLREVVPFVHHRKSKRGESVRISYRIRNTTKVCKLDPLYVIDGKLTRNSAYFLSLLPQDILFLKIINNPSKLVQWGKLGENGVILVEMKNQDSQAKVPAHFASVVGLTQAKKDMNNRNPSARKFPARIPDLRSTMYWSGLMPVEPFRPVEFSFTTSDDIGTFVIQITGFTASGEPIFFEQEFVVEPGKGE